MRKPSRSSSNSTKRLNVPWFRKQGAGWYTSAIYRARTDRTFVENALIDLYKPMLNRTIVLSWLEQDPRNHAILHTLYAAGLRVSELCNLRWRHVIRREEGVQLDIMSGKGDKQRHVLLGDSSCQVVSRHRS